MASGNFRFLLFRTVRRKIVTGRIRPPPARERPGGFGARLCPAPSGISRSRFARSDASAKSRDLATFVGAAAGRCDTAALRGCARMHQPCVRVSPPHHCAAVTRHLVGASAPTATKLVCVSLCETACHRLGWTRTIPTCQPTSFIPATKSCRPWSGSTAIA